MCSGARVTGGPVAGFIFTNNLVNHNAYGIFGIGQSYGNGTLAYYAPGAVVQRNVMANNAPSHRAIRPTTCFPSLAAFNATFRNAAAQDYRLVAGSPYANAGTDGRNIGCDFTTLYAAAPPAARAGFASSSEPGRAAEGPTSRSPGSWPRPSRGQRHAHQIDDDLIRPAPGHRFGEFRCGVADDHDIRLVDHLVDGLAEQLRQVRDLLLDVLLVGAGQARERERSDRRCGPS